MKEDLVPGSTDLLYSGFEHASLAGRAIIDIQSVKERQKKSQWTYIWVCIRGSKRDSEFREDGILGMTLFF